MAIESVLTKLYQSVQQFQSDKKLDVPRDELWDKFLSSIKSVDISECPEDFRVAYIKYTNTWVGLYIEIEKEPKSYWDGVLGGIILGVKSALELKSPTSLVKDYDAHQQTIDAREGDILTSWNDVQVIAVKYGARLAPD